MQLIRHKHFIAIIALGAMFTLASQVVALNIDSTDKYAWGENIGWLNFGTTQGDVDVTTTTMDGYAWGENVGWISLTCLNTSSCATVDYGAEILGSTVSGYIWGENAGWISLNCSNTSSCGTVDYGVSVDTTTKEFSGYAWGENVGWISFNCSNTASCDAVDYKVVTTATLVGGSRHHPEPPAPAITESPSPELSPSATPSGSPSTTPSVSPIPTPEVGTPTPSVGAPTPTASNPPIVATPPALPPMAMPSAPPGPIHPESEISPVVGIVNSIGGAIDAITQSIIRSATTVSAYVISVAKSITPLTAPIITFIVAIPVAVSGVSAAAASGSPAGFAVSQFRYLLEIVGLKRKRRVWGIIYDSKTKNPIPYAKIDLRDQANRILETRFADKDGRYGFLTSAASLHQQAIHVSLAPLSPAYTFPSTIVTKDPDFIVYNHIYTGGTITISKDILLNYNIPLDSSSNLKPVTLSRPLLDRALTSVMNVGFWIGIVAAPLNAIIFPSIYSISVLGIFILANTFRVSADLYRPFGLVYDSTTHKPLAYALVTLNKPTGERIAFSVSDEQGRYFLLTDPGSYTLTVYAPANVEPQRSQTIRLTSKKGWIREKIAV